MDIEEQGVVLIVEDDPLILKQVSYFLTKKGFRIIGRALAVDIEDTLSKTPADIVLTDISLPDISGIDLMEKIHDIDAEMPVILMTAYADLGTAVSAIKKGAFDFIIKPFDLDYLLHALEKAMRHRRFLRKEREYRNRIEEMNRQLTNEIHEREKAAQEREKLISELKGALATIKTLHGILPICSSCKKIRDDKGYWNQIEAYISKHTEADFSHGICPECSKKLYPEYHKRKGGKEEG